MAVQETYASPSEATSEAHAADYAHELISSRRVEGTSVYSGSGERLGTIHSVMIGKRSGQVAYAVLSAGGWLGIGAHVHPLPWELLTYDVDRDGYVVAVDRDQLKQAPSMTLDETDRPIDRDYQEKVSSYWGTLPWWGL
ncbi:MAG TPA: PRC-barrel domain-containing protein [Allosphingosinicella sp.]|nr:PRC-barrel domain-containing protein [Allosphingosinicella sp.]